MACDIRRNCRAPRVRLLLDGEESEVLEEAIALKHRRVDRRKRRAAREELARQEQADKRVPPRGMVEINHERARGIICGCPLFRIRKA